MNGTERMYWGCPSVRYSVVRRNSNYYLDSTEKGQTYHSNEAITMAEAMKHKARWEGCSYGDCACNCQ